MLARPVTIVGRGIRNRPALNSRPDDRAPSAPSQAIAAVLLHELGEHQVLGQPCRVNWVRLAAAPGTPPEFRLEERVRELHR
jgi:hypothetical protein